MMGIKKKKKQREEIVNEFRRAVLLGGLCVGRNT
jgi:hypothetical protein